MANINFGDHKNKIYSKYTDKHNGDLTHLSDFIFCIKNNCIHYIMTTDK